MALFNFAVDEWAFFLFIFASLAIYTGAIGSYSGHAPTWGLAQVFEVPFQLVTGTFNSPFALLTPFVFVAVVWLVVKGFAKTVDPAIMGAVIFGVIVLSLGA